MASKGRRGKRIPSAGEPKREQAEAKQWPMVLIAIPTERSIMVEAMDGIVGVAMHAALHGWGLVSFAYRRCDLARNIAAHHLLESPAEYLCMLDSDHKHPPDVVDKLVSCVMAHPDLDIVAGLNYRRSVPHEPMAYMFSSDHGMSIINNYDQPGLVTVDAVATPSILIHRRVFEALEPPWFYYDYANYNHGNSASEDIVFFRRLKREAPQFKIAVHTQITSPHLFMEGVGDAARYEKWAETQPRNEDGAIVWSGAN